MLSSPACRPTPGGPQRAPGAREGSRGTTLSPARPARTPGTGSSDKALPGPVTPPGPRLAAKATPGPGHHPTTAAVSPAPDPARGRGTAGHSPIAATLP